MRWRSRGRRSRSVGCGAGGSGEGEGEVECGAFAFLAFCPDVAVVSFDHLFGDVEADAESTDGVLGVVDAVIAVENILEVLFGDADAAVSDADDGIARGAWLVREDRHGEGLRSRVFVSGWGPGIGDAF